MTDDYTNLDRACDAVANSDWMDTGHVDPYTIAEGYAFFDRVIRKVKAEAWGEGHGTPCDKYVRDDMCREFHRNPYRD